MWRLVVVARAAPQGPSAKSRGICCYHQGRLNGLFFNHRLKGRKWEWEDERKRGKKGGWHAWSSDMSLLEDVNKQTLSAISTTSFFYYYLCMVLKKRDNKGRGGSFWNNPLNLTHFQSTNPIYAQKSLHTENLPQTGFGVEKVNSGSVMHNPLHRQDAQHSISEQTTTSSSASVLIAHRPRPPDIMGLSLGVGALRRLTQEWASKFICLL